MIVHMYLNGVGGGRGRGGKGGGSAWRRCTYIGLTTVVHVYSAPGAPLSPVEFIDHFPSNIVSLYLLFLRVKNFTILSL